jgi:hypothetical protein
VKVEWLILADYAEIVGNKLYVQGGGWDVFTVNTGFPANKICGLAASVRVPWNETNQRHDFEIEVQTDDGQSLAKINAQFEVGRPPGLPSGQDQRWQVGGNLGLTFEKPGTYAIVARIEGQEDGRIHFNVIPGPMLAMQQPPRQEGAA